MRLFFVSLHGQHRLYVPSHSGRCQGRLRRPYSHPHGQHWCTSSTYSCRGRWPGVRPGSRSHPARAATLPARTAQPSGSHTPCPRFALRSTSATPTSAENKGKTEKKGSRKSPVFARREARILARREARTVQPAAIAGAVRATTESGSCRRRSRTMA